MWPPWSRSSSKPFLRGRPRRRCTTLKTQEERHLHEITCWLHINQIASERNQFNYLQVQGLANIYRRVSLRALLHCSSFRESISTSISTTVEVPKGFLRTLQDRMAEHAACVEQGDQETMDRLLENVAKLISRKRTTAWRRSRITSRSERCPSPKQPHHVSLAARMSLTYSCCALLHRSSSLSGKMMMT